MDPLQQNVDKDKFSKRVVQNNTLQKLDKNDLKLQYPKDSLQQQFAKFDKMAHNSNLQNGCSNQQFAKKNVR